MSETKWKTDGGLVIDEASGEVVAKVAFNPKADTETKARTFRRADLIAAAPLLYDEGNQSALTLDEAANILEGNFPGVARICRTQAEHQRAAMARARGEKQ